MADSITLNGGTLQDSDGNNLFISLGSLAPSNLDDVIVDTLGPSVSFNNATIEPGGYSVLPINVVVEEEVTVDTSGGVPRIAVTINGNARWAEYQPPSDPSTASTNLLFTYTAAAGENDLDGIDSVGDSVEFNGGVIQDTAGNAMDAVLVRFLEASAHQF